MQERGVYLGKKQLLRKALETGPFLCHNAEKGLHTIMWFE